jgi:hypothetical protein
MSVTRRGSEAGATVAVTLSQVQQNINLMTDPKVMVQEVFKWYAVKQNSEIFSYHVRPPPGFPFLPF